MVVLGAGNGIRVGLSLVPGMQTVWGLGFTIRVRKC
jgi:hypothetical protein